MIFVELVEVRLDRLVSIHKDKPNSIARQTADKRLGILDHRPNTAVQTWHVDWMFSRERVKFFCREPAVPSDLVEHFLRCDAGKLAHRRA